MHMIKNKLSSKTVNVEEVEQSRLCYFVDVHRYQRARSYFRSHKVFIFLSSDRTQI